MSHSLNVIGVLRSPQLRSELEQVCTDMNGTRFDLRVAPIEQIMADPMLPPPDVLMIEVDPQSSSELALLHDLVERQRGGGAVVATTANATLDDVRKLMRLGVTDVIPQPIQRDDVLAALDAAAKVHRVKPAGAHKGRLISVLKGGGGVGATTIAVQTGCSLAERLRKQGAEVCLLDLDVQGGTVALYLDLNNRVGLADLVDLPERLDTALLQGALVQHKSSLSVVAAPRDVMPLDSFSADFIRRLTDVARSRFEIVLADLPPVWSQWTFETLRCSDEVLLVTQMTVPGIRQARHQLDTLKTEGLGELPVKVILNRFEKRWGSTLSLKEVEKALGHSVDFTIANDYRTVSDALDQGVFLSEIRRRSKALKSVTNLSKSLTSPGATAQERVEPHLAGMNS